MRTRLNVTTGLFLMNFISLFIMPYCFLKMILNNSRISSLLDPIEDMRSKIAKLLKFTNKECFDNLISYAYCNHVLNVYQGESSSSFIYRSHYVNKHYDEEDCFDGIFNYYPECGAKIDLNLLKRENN